MCPEVSNPNYKPHFLFPFAFQQMLLTSSPLLISDKTELIYRTQKNKKLWCYFILALFYK